MTTAIDGDGRLVLRLADLADGGHVIDVLAPRGLLLPPTRRSLAFTVDTTPPSFQLVEPRAPVAPGTAVVVRGRTDDHGAEVTIDGQPAPVVDGGFRVRLSEPPAGPVAVTLTDAAGNTAQEQLSIALALPGLEGQPPIRGVHASGHTWSTPELKDPILELIREGLVNTVQLDLKDEGGDVWYASNVPLAAEVGAVQPLYDLEKAVAELHDLGVRVIGRIVCFRDPRLADWAVEHDDLELVVQNPNGTALSQYGGYTNFAHPDVQEYNIALAEEAARAGVDDIMYDYVRRPDQALSRMRIPGLSGEPEDAIVDFLALSQPRVHAAGARLGAAVFGIAATRPQEIAQDIPRMAEHVDYIAPMVYPSHWGPGEYGVADPNASPYDIVLRSMEDFVGLLDGTDAGLISWLQDFSLGRTYGPAEVRAQIDATVEAEVPDFILWDAATTYTAAALSS
jgi:hypothetical protein